MCDTTDDNKSISPTVAESFVPSWLKFILFFNWNNGSQALLSEVEEKLLKYSNSTYSVKYIPLRDANHRIWTLSVHSSPYSQNQPSTTQTNDSGLTDRAPLVFLHSLCTGIGLWISNLSTLSKCRRLYAFDLLGFGKSSRCNFSSNPYVAEIEWVESIEEWRVSMGLQSMYLLGHGLGGFIAASYALRYPKRVRRLILVEPWGIAERPPDLEIEPRVLPLWVRIMAGIVRPFNPLTALRVAGPWAPTLMRRLRPDLGEKFSPVREISEAVYDYIYQCNIQTPATGETAFCTLSDPFGWAQNPLIRRIGRLSPNIGITVIYGARSWLDPRDGELIAEARVSHMVTLGSIDASQPIDTWSLQDKLAIGRVDVHVLPQAGHHVYSDQATMFNELISRILSEDDAMPSFDSLPIC